jgi:hypothetical protein
MAVEFWQALYGVEILVWQWYGHVINPKIWHESLYCSTKFNIMDESILEPLYGYKINVNTCIK